jgi:hypothetical protein
MKVLLHQARVVCRKAGLTAGPPVSDAVLQKGLLRTEHHLPTVLHRRPSDAPSKGRLIQHYANFRRGLAGWQLGAISD